MTQRLNKGRAIGSKNFQLWQKDFLNDWLNNNYSNMYPSEVEKVKIAQSLGVEKSKVSNWFINMRKRHFQHDAEVQMNKYRYKPKLQHKRTVRTERNNLETTLKFDKNEAKLFENLSKLVANYCACDLESYCCFTTDKSHAKQLELLQEASFLQTQKIMQTELNQPQYDQTSNTQNNWSILNYQPNTQKLRSLNNYCLCDSTSLRLNELIQSKYFS